MPHLLVKQENNMQDTQTQLNQLSNDLMVIVNQFNSLLSSHTIPREVETAIRERLSFSSVVSSPGTTGSAATQVVNVPSVPVNITVPAQPSGTVAMTINNVTYNLLYK